MAKRDYKSEYKKFQSSEEQKKKRAGRNKVRRKAVKKGTVKKGDGMDMSHTKNGVVKKPRSVNRGSSSDQAGDRRSRGKGQKKNQPKRGRK
jgi:hypothetical protein